MQRSTHKVTAERMRGTDQSLPGETSPENTRKLTHPDYMAMKHGRKDARRAANRVARKARRRARRG